MSSTASTPFVVQVFSNNDTHVDAVSDCVLSNGLNIDSQDIATGPARHELLFSATLQQAWDVFQQLLAVAQQYRFDTSVMPVNQGPVRLLVCDMDSTVVASETLDDLAEKANVGKRVSEITARAMRGEIDFIGALQERVGLLAGVDESLLTDVAYATQCNRGADVLITAARQHGIRTVLVSGGFEPVVAHVAGQLGFDRYVCNRMDMANGKLTGKVLEPIVDAGTKLQTLREECNGLGIDVRQACCIGDGANDLPMLQEAGIGISYMGKPLLCDVLAYQVNYSDLASVIPLLGIGKIH